MLVKAKVKDAEQQAQLRRLVQAAEALGLDVRVVDTGERTVAFECGELPSVYEAGKMRTRGAGRPRAHADLPAGSVFAAVGTTVDDVLAYAGEHTGKECQEQLGMSAATYYRRLREWRGLTEKGRGKDPLYLHM